MVDATAVKTYEIEYVGDVLLEENGAAIIRFESAAHERVSIIMGRRLLEHLLLDIQSVLATKLPVIRRG